MLRQRTEHEEQIKLCFAIKNFISKDYPDLEYIHSVPNGLFLQQGVRSTFINEGGKSGVADLIWDKRSGIYSGLRLEMKRPDGKGKLSVNQKRYRDFEEANGFKFATAITAIEGLQVIVDYATYPQSIIERWEPLFNKYSHADLMQKAEKGLLLSA